MDGANFDAVEWADEVECNYSYYGVAPWASRTEDRSADASIMMCGEEATRCLLSQALMVQSFCLFLLLTSEQLDERKVVAAEELVVNELTTSSCI